MSDEIRVRLQAIIERDRSTVANGISGVRNAINRRAWLRDGRGSYAYDDDRWKDEFGAAITEIEDALFPLVLVAANRSDSPITAEEIMAARAIPLSEPDLPRVDVSEDPLFEEVPPGYLIVPQRYSLKTGKWYRGKTNR